MGDFVFFDPSIEPICLPACPPDGEQVCGPWPKTARSFEDLGKLLLQGNFGAVLFRASSPALEETLAGLKNLCPELPTVFLFAPEQRPYVMKLFGKGVHACICEEGLTWEGLLGAIECALGFKQILEENTVLRQELAETRLDVETHRRAYRRLSDDLRSAEKSLASMGEFNRLFFHATDEQSTVRNFCRALVKGHGYRMAWVAHPEESPDGLELVPIAHAGDEQGFLSQSFRSREGIHALSEGHPWVIQDIRKEGACHPWSGRALERRYHSVAAVPFRIDGEPTLRVLCVFDEKTEAFSADRLAMLVDMTKMLSAGLRILGEKIRRQANNALLDLMSRAVETSVSGFVIFSISEGIQYANNAALFLAGYSCQEEVLGCPYRNFVVANEKTPEILETVFRGGNWTGECDLIRKDGSLLEVFCSVSAVQKEREEAPSILVSFTDLSEKRKAERALLESRTFYEAIIKDQADMILRFLPDTLEITYANVPYARYYGKDPGDFIGQSFKCRYSPEEEIRIREHLKALTPENPVRQIEEKVFLPNGQVRWQHWIDCGIFDASGRLVEVQGVGRDITSLKSIQEELRQEKRKLEMFFANSPEGIVFCSAEQIVETANDAFLKMFGYTENEVVGRHIDDLLGEPPEQREAARDLNRVAEDGATRTLEGTRIGKNGQPLFVSVSVIPRTEPDGRTTGTYAIYRDLTERQQKEEALMISHTIIEGSPAVVFRWKAEKGWPIEYVSENIRQFGYTPGELTAAGFLYSSIIHPDDRARVEDEASRFDLEQRESFCHQYRIVMKNGQSRWVVERNRAERDKSGRLLHHFGVVMDDTERRQAETEARKNHEALQHSLRQLEASFRKTIEVLSSTTEARDPYTAGHQRKVATLSVAIARRMGLSEKTCEGIYLAAMVHDVGKISIPAELLSKPSKLNPVERALIMTHPESAYEILRKVDSPWNLAEIVRQHHERMDGSGYPSGLRGEEILTEARIIAVADVFEAVASDRPYRPGLGLEAAMAALETGKGTEFDPEVVDTCRNLLNEGFTFDEEGPRVESPAEREGSLRA